MSELNEDVREFFSLSHFPFFSSFTFHLVCYNFITQWSPRSWSLSASDWKEKQKSAFWDQLFRQRLIFLSRRNLKRRTIWIICVLPGKIIYILSAVYAHWLSEEKKKKNSISVVYLYAWLTLDRTSLHKNTRCSFEGRENEKCKTTLTCLKRCSPTKKKRKRFLLKNKGKEMSHELSR